MQDRLVPARADKQTVGCKQQSRCAPTTRGLERAVGCPQTRRARQCGRPGAGPDDRPQWGQSAPADGGEFDLLILVILPGPQPQQRLPAATRAKLPLALFHFPSRALARLCGSLSQQR